MMLLTVEPKFEMSQRFQSLSLSIPLDPSQFDYIKQFLHKLLNVKNSNTISTTNLPYDPNECYEILPDITLPNDIWFKQGIFIKDCKLKVTILNEVHSMINQELNQIDQPLDDTILLYYQKILLAYKFYDMPVRTSVMSENDFSLKEDIDEETDEFESKLLNRTISNQSSTTSLKTHFSFFSHSSNTNNVNNLNGTKRNLILSKEVKNNGPRRRLLSVISTHQQTGEEEIEDDGKKQQALNSLLLKSKLYNKIKKHRELTSSMTSNVSSMNYSGRNSLSTTNNSSKRSSSNLTLPDNSDLKHPSFVSIPPFASYTTSQKQESQRIKQEYYNQIEQLVLLIDKILYQLNLNHRDAKCFKLMDFIKRFIFKFIVIDVTDMIMTYGEIEAFKLYSKLGKS